MSEVFESALRRTVAQAKAPGAVGYVGQGGETLFWGAHGQRQTVPVTRALEKDTPYDLASLTKVIATTTAIMILRDDGVLDLDQPVAAWAPLPAFRAFTIRHLLTHTSGLPAFKLWYTEVASIDEMLQRIAGLEAAWPPGTRRRYSDLGFMILGRLVELAARDSLGAFCRKRIFAPLGMTRTGFCPPAELQPHCAATEQCPWRDRVLVGEVHDEHAAAIGGVAGHAGLFGTAGDVARFCRGLLEGKILSEATLAEMVRPGQVPTYPWQGLGWKLDPWMVGSEGYLPARSAMGHTGWTGTSLWLDRESGVFSILLSNTCHPSREKRNNRALRQTFHIHVAAQCYPDTSNVHTGLDRVLWDGFDPLLGKRIGLLTNHAAVDQAGRHILDVIALQPEVMLTRIFSPEHGLRGHAEAGEAVASENGPIPVVSLYGKRRKPTAEELGDLELFVVDLPDIGARYYTYMATMKDCLEACAVAGVPVLVLDRPNPLGGTVIEGPIATVTKSLVCCAPIPIRHGMTLGELALFFQKTVLRGKKLRLMVNTVSNWPRERMHGACSLPWIPPSPNIPDAETALVYVGNCLFEGTNLNEGRGTETPFRLIGAPWLNPMAVLDRLESQALLGFEVAPKDYTPRSMPGKAAKPRFQDTACRGLHIAVTDAGNARPFSLAAALLRAIRERHAKNFAWGTSFDTLAGGPWLREQIEGGASVHEITEAIAPDLVRFGRKQPRRYQTLAEMIADTAKA